MLNSSLISKIYELNLPSMPEAEFRNVENKLNIRFSDDFINIARVVDFQYMNCFDMNNFLLENNRSVIGETLAMREHGLPNDTLVLFEEYESIMLMKCLGTHEEIYWIAIEDFERFCNGEKLEYDYTFFPTFTAFFEYLLDEEEKERAGKNCD